VIEHHLNSIIHLASPTFQVATLLSARIRPVPFRSFWHPSPARELSWWKTAINMLFG